MSELLIGKQAPNFCAQAAQGVQITDNFSLEDLKGHYVIFFFYPMDFTFVCPTEIHAFQEALETFEKKNAKVVGCSTDSVYSHLAWLNTPKNKGGIEGVSYPLVSDIHKDIAKSYGVLSQEEGIAFRGLFLIDKEGVVRHQLINDLPIGRSIDEVVRVLDALVFFEENGDVCPANWHSGATAMTPSQQGLDKYFGA